MTARTTRHRVLALVLGTLAFAATAMVPTPAEAQEERNPVIFVHGWFLTDVWGPALADFQANGYDADELFVFTYDTFGTSNSQTALDFGAFLEDVLRQTGAERADVISHSMGSLSTRECIKFGDCEGRVDNWVSLGGANHGTYISWLCLFFSPTTCAEMSPGSDYLTRLNQPPEVTDGAESWTTLWSPLDGVIIPAESTVLEGADNIRLPASVNHLSMLSDPGVLAQVRDVLDS
jgi:triacylglycerol lipase